MTEKLKADSWTTTDELLAITAEQVNQLLIVTIRANSKNPPNIEPLEIPRPYAQAKDVPQVEVVGHFDALTRMGGSTDAV